MEAEEVISTLGLEPLAGEGGMWAPIFNNGISSAIYFLMADPDFSAWHRIPEQEMWIHLAGSPTMLYTYDENQDCSATMLDHNSMHFQTIVKPRQWMAAKPLGSWSLLICTLTPAFTAMELASYEEVSSWRVDSLPQDEILRLLHD
jgi:predicted cupin superfamily sugar epimerase